MKRIKHTTADWVKAIIEAEDEAINGRYIPALRLTPKIDTITQNGIQVVIEAPRTYEQQESAS